MRDVVELFGQNFDVTMETVFATLEHTLRMLGTTGESRDFKRDEITAKRDRLKQALAVALEDSLTERTEGRASSQTPRPCKHHEKFVTSVLRLSDTVITFNYDCVLDHALRTSGSRKWNARYGYGLPVGAGTHLLEGHDAWQPKEPAPKTSTVHLYKLHGSLHFRVPEKEGSPVTLKQRPYTRQAGDLRFTILPPESQKAYDKGIFRELWRAAGVALHRARHVIVIGYSLPPTDLHSTALLRTSVKRRALRSLVIVNPDPLARHRIRSVLQRGLAPETRVLSFDHLREFVAADRSVWRLPVTTK